MSKIRDNDYLCISAMLRGKEAHMIGADAFARMAEAENAQAAAKIAEEYGYTDLDLSTPQTVDASLGRIRAAVYEDLTGILPQRALLDLFRLKYDYHNAKILVKNASRDQDVSGMLSPEGRLSIDEIKELFASETASGVLKDAMTEAADTLAKTQNPQLSEPFTHDEIFHKADHSKAEAPHCGADPIGYDIDLYSSRCLFIMPVKADSHYGGDCADDQ